MDEHSGSQSGIVRLAVVEESGDVVHGQTADEAGDECVQKDGLQIGDGDLEEHLYVVGAVDFGGLINFGIDAQNTGDQNDHSVAVPLPELNEGYDALGCGLTVNEGKGAFTQSAGNQEVIHRAHGIAKQGIEQNGHGCRRDDIGHVENDLEKALALQDISAAGEPGGQQQRHGDLGNEIHDPDLKGILYGSDKRGIFKNLCKILEGLLDQEVPVGVAQTFQSVKPRIAVYTVGYRLKMQNTTMKGMLNR